MGCTSTKQTSHSSAAVKHDQELAATLLQTQQSEQKADHTKTGENRAAAVSHQDTSRVTKVSSNVMMVEFTPPEDEDEVEQPSTSTRKGKRKVTPWHGGGAAADIDDDEIDDDDAEEEEVAEPKQPTTKETMDRKAVRNASPLNKGSEALESDHDDQKQGHEERHKDTEGAPDAGGSVFGLLGVCCRPCIAQEETFEPLR
eukprot:TRINITY_DN407_c0_g2_i1.p1 TRINITY_DN407_c0_g2~~TRINITY_DN407_c0_g2_i1.p1  ORF type:complete len:200 (-),score=57.82 TRINITY_DN407_c0_g2_i1:455-1054(-)